MTAPPGRRPDASMTLLTEVMERPLDPGYAAAAEARERLPDAGTQRRRDRRRAPVTVLVAGVLGVLLVSAILQLRVPESAGVRDVLLEEIEARTESADTLAGQVEQLRLEVQEIQGQALSEDGDTVLEVADRLALHAGATPVVGPGVVVTLDDAAEALEPLAGDPREADVQEDRVVDLDVQITVNGLWAAGAEAIAVNGQRLTSLSAIRWAGGAILVGFRPLQPPYRIAAIGDPDDLRTSLAASDAGGYLAFVQDRYGLQVAIEPAEELELPGAGPLQLRYARPATSPVQDGMEESEVSPP